MFDVCLRVFVGAWEVLVCLMNGGTLHLRGSSWEETLDEVSICCNLPDDFAKRKRLTPLFQRLRSYPSTDGTASPISKLLLLAASRAPSRELPTTPINLIDRLTELQTSG